MRETKRCPRCGETKAISEFIRPRATVDRTPTTYCAPCRKAKRRAEYERAGGSQVSYAQVLQREYGLTVAEYDALLARQAFRCAICHRPETTRTKATGEVRRLTVDHDHVTGKVRGLLCLNCNRVVWALEENHLSLTAIQSYLDAFRASLAP